MRYCINFKYILLILTLTSIFISCGVEDKFDGLSSETAVIEGMIADAHTIWHIPESQVQEKMADFRLVDSDSDFLLYETRSGMIRVAYSFVDDCLQAMAVIMPKSSGTILSGNLLGKYENLGELSSKTVYHNDSENTMCFLYETASGDTEYTVMGFTPIVSDLFKGDIKPKVDYKNLAYSIDDRHFKMILVDGGNIPAFYMMQTELPLSGDFKINNVSIGKIDSNGDKCITKGELRVFIRNLDEATGLDFRLPTENEWKFAASGGVNSGNHKYSGSDNIDDVAWYSGNCSGLQKIASKQPNELGFYDMSGNYAEVCGRTSLDIDGKTYGGCWKYAASKCTPSSYQIGDDSANKIPGTSIKEMNAVDGRYITVRLAYSSLE